MFNKNEENKRELELKGLPIVPENTTETFFKITVETVKRTVVPEMETIYFNEETGKIVNSWDSGENKSTRVFTGNTEIKTQETRVYEQEVRSFDVSDLAVYINGVK